MLMSLIFWRARAGAFQQRAPGEGAQGRNQDLSSCQHMVYSFENGSFLLAESILNTPRVLYFDCAGKH